MECQYNRINGITMSKPFINPTLHSFNLMVHGEGMIRMNNLFKSTFGDWFDNFDQKVYHERKMRKLKDIMSQLLSRRYIYSSIYITSVSYEEDALYTRNLLMDI